MTLPAACIDGSAGASMPNARRSSVASGLVSSNRTSTPSQLVWLADAAGSDDPGLPRLDPGVDGIASVRPLLAFGPGLKVEHDRLALVLAAAGQREPWQPVVQARIQIQIAKRQLRTLELGDRVLQLGIEHRQLVWIEDGAADALLAGFGQHFLERTLRLAGRLLEPRR